MHNHAPAKGIFNWLIDPIILYYIILTELSIQLNDEDRNHTHIYSKYMIGCHDLTHKHSTSDKMIVLFISQYVQIT